MALSRRLPGHHLETDSRDAVRLVAGFVAALAALVLGLLVASAKANYDERSGQLHRIAADVVALDRTLAHYGEGAREIRAVLRSALVDEFNRLSAGSPLEGPVQDVRLLGFYDRLQALAPQNEGQRVARDRATQLAEGIAATRVLMTQDPGGSIPPPFLLVLGFWLAAMFASFGLFARANATVVASLLLGAASVAGAVFLILELDRPLDGLMRLSMEPLRHAVETVGH
ncbi:MAG: hypothetical protein JOZ42_01035 [Acetobacteraceae bacterium]|nr:hypothetical protein [Acetobacteraceae bacterium]